MSLAPATAATASTVSGAVGLVGAGLVADRATGTPSGSDQLGLLPATGFATVALALAGIALIMVGLALFRLSVRAGGRAVATRGAHGAG